MQEEHFTIGKCFNNEDACLKERYDLSNVTEIAGIQLDQFQFDGADWNSDLLRYLRFQNIETMNCEDLCNCLSCGMAHCSDQKNQDNCPGNESGYICRCATSPSYPSFNVISKDMLLNGLVCRQCDI